MGFNIPRSYRLKAVMERKYSSLGCNNGGQSRLSTLNADNFIIRLFGRADFLARRHAFLFGSGQWQTQIR